MPPGRHRDECSLLSACRFTSVVLLPQKQELLVVHCFTLAYLCLNSQWTVWGLSLLPLHSVKFRLAVAPQGWKLCPWAARGFRVLILCWGLIRHGRQGSQASSDNSNKSNKNRHGEAQTAWRGKVRNKNIFLSLVFHSSQGWAAVGYFRNRPCDFMFQYLDKSWFTWSSFGSHLGGFGFAFTALKSVFSGVQLWMHVKVYQEDKVLKRGIPRSERHTWNFHRYYQNGFQKSLCLCWSVLLLLAGFLQAPVCSRPHSTGCRTPSLFFARMMLGKWWLIVLISVFKIVGVLEPYFHMDISHFSMNCFTFFV